MYCGKCGCKLPEDALFCINCGAPADNDTSGSSGSVAYVSSKKKARLLFPVIVLLAIMLIACGVLFLFHSKPELRCKIFGHKWVEPTCTERGYCEICGQEGDDKIPHDFDKKGKCRVCGKQSDEKKKTETASPTTDTPATTVEAKPHAPKVGIALPTKDLQRWANDGEKMAVELVDAGYEVELHYAANDIATQIAQIYNLIDCECDVIIIAAIDGSSLREVLDSAKEHGIAVIAYDRLIFDTDALTCYVTFDNYMTGMKQGEYIVEALDLDNNPGPFNIEITTGDPYDNNSSLFYNGAMDVLMPYIDQGTLNVMSDQWTFEEVCTPNWSTDEAEKRAANIIKTYYSNGKNIDAWMCSNDSTALGVTNALMANYTGSYPVITGQDCDILNIKNIISGKQSMSIFKDTRILASQTVKITDQIMKGTDIDINDTVTYNNGVMTVPAFLCEPVWADADNYKMVLVDSGYYTEDMLIR